MQCEDSVSLLLSLKREEGGCEARPAGGLEKLGKPREGMLPWRMQRGRSPANTLALAHECHFKTMTFRAVCSAHGHWAPAMYTALFWDLGENGKNARLCLIGLPIWGKKIHMCMWNLRYKVVEDPQEGKEHSPWSVLEGLAVFWISHRPDSQMYVWEDYVCFVMRMWGNAADLTFCISSGQR